MKKTALIFGAIGGITVIIYSYITFAFLDLDHITSLPPEKLPARMMWAETLGYMRYLILIIGIILAMRAMKKETGSNTYGRALGIGILVTLTTAFFIGGMEYVYIQTHPHFFDNYMKLNEQMMSQAGVPDAELQRQAEEMKSYAFMTTPFANFILYFIETTLIGSVTSLVSAAFFRK